MITKHLGSLPPGVPVIPDRKPSPRLPLQLNGYMYHEISSICAFGNPSSGLRRSIWKHIGTMKKSSLYPQCSYSDPYWYSITLYQQQKQCLEACLHQYTGCNNARVKNREAKMLPTFCYSLSILILLTGLIFPTIIRMTLNLYFKKNTAILLESIKILMLLPRQRASLKSWIRCGLC